ncbi:glutaredoxin family protein [Rhodococcus aerolatus]
MEPVTTPGRALTLLTRAGCVACDAALRDLTAVADEAGLPVAVVDVDDAAARGEPGLRAEFGDRLPVVLLDGDEHGYWDVDVPRLRADLGLPPA